jgi:predicted nucleotidyltransferase
VKRLEFFQDPAEISHFGSLFQEQANSLFEVPGSRFFGAAGDKTGDDGLSLAICPPGSFDLGENIGRTCSMNKDQVIAKLREHEPELKATGITRLAVFGSVARGDDSPGSDVDLLADFDKTKHYTLLTVGRLESRLADMLGTRVDLSSPEWLKESIKTQVLREAVRAF